MEQEGAHAVKLVASEAQIATLPPPRAVAFALGKSVKDELDHWGFTGVTVLSHSAPCPLMPHPGAKPLALRGCARCACSSCRSSPSSYHSFKLSLSSPVATQIECQMAAEAAFLRGQVSQDPTARGQTGKTEKFWTPAAPDPAGVVAMQNGVRSAPSKAVRRVLERSPPRFGKLFLS